MGKLRRLILEKARNERMTLRLERILNVGGEPDVGSALVSTPPASSRRGANKALRPKLVLTGTYT